MKSPSFKEKYPEEYAYIRDNADELNNSKRYWLAVERIQAIEEEERKVAEMQRRIDKARRISQVEIYEVLEGRGLTAEEKQRVRAEFGFGEEQSRMKLASISTTDPEKTL